MQSGSGNDFSQQEAAGLDMFVGSGLDFLSEVTMDDLEMGSLAPADVTPLGLTPEAFATYAPMAASLGPPGAGLPFTTMPYYPQAHMLPHPATANTLQPGPFPTGQAPDRLLQTSASNSPTSQQASHSGDLGQPGLAQPEAVDAKTKLKEKNKRAQKRFREKKRLEAQDNEKHLADLLAELEQIKLERSKVEERNQLLETVLSLNKETTIDTRNLFEVPPEESHALPKPFQTGAAQIDAFPDADQMLPVSIAQSDSKLMAVRDIKAMSWEQHLGMWKGYISKMAVLLDDAKDDPESPAGLEVSRTIQEAIMVCGCKAVHDPYGVQHFFTARLEESLRISKEKDLQPQARTDMMATVVESLKLTEQQREKLMQLRQWALPRVGRLMRERERISHSLQGCTSSSSNLQAAFLNSNHLSQAHMQAADILAELYANLREDSILMGQMSTAIWRQMMTPFQMANIIVQFYPWPPDTGELLNLLAAQAGQPHATELLGFTDSSPTDRKPAASTQAESTDSKQVVAATQQSGVQGNKGTAGKPTEQSATENSKQAVRPSRHSGLQVNEHLGVLGRELLPVSAAPQPSSLPDSNKTAGPEVPEVIVQVKQESQCS